MMLRRLGGFFRRREEVIPDLCADISIDSTTMGSTTGADVLASLKHFEKMHHLDPNLPLEELIEVEAALNESNAEKGVEIEQVLVEDNSPYPEVRASVRNFDVDLPANTIRAWVIGLLLCTVGSAINMLFSLRNPTVSITTYVIQLIAYPIGLGWDLVFPDRVWNVLGIKFNLKPGPFNFKEHVIIVVMSNAAYGGGALYATDVIIAQQKWYTDQNFGWGWQILLGISTLCTGYGIAGLARRFLVWPAAMIWPSSLVNAAMFYTLHDHSRSDPLRTNGWSIGRYRWFLIVFTGAFVWYWVPGWLFKGLSWFCWITWIWPESVVVNELFGGKTGYGLLPITFDWTVISGYALSPLIPPFHATANVLAGVIVFFVIISMGIRYTGSWYSDYLPVSNYNAYDNTGAVYNVTRILKGGEFDEVAYMNYSPLFLPTQFAIAYGLAFAAVSAVIVHVVLYHGRAIKTQMKLARSQEDDVHMRLMKKYQDAEDWWYAVLFIGMVSMSFAVVCAWNTNFPWWAYVVCMLIPMIWTIPIGIIQAITNIQLGLNVLTEFIVGYMLPGRPLATMLFKTYSYMCSSQALYFAQDLKLGHYMKVPPRAMFWSQLVASIWSVLVQLSVTNWALGNIPQVCEEHQKDGFTCANQRTFYTASVIWGAVGPKRMFSGDALYSSLQWFWLIGAISPIITWFLARRYPRSIWRFVNLPLLFGGSGWIPPATVYIFLCWGIVGSIFNYFIRRRWMGWWLHLNYITSAALDCGLAICTLVIFFALYLTNTDAPNWYGNNITTQTLDANTSAIKIRLENGQKFGPSVWP